MFNVHGSGTAIGVSIVTALIICILFIILMSYYSEGFVYLSIALFWIGNAGAVVVAWMMYSKQANAIAIHKQGTDAGSKALLKEAEHKATLFMVGMIALGIILVCFTTCLCCLWKALQTAVDVIDASSDFLRDTFRIALVPVIHFILGTVVFFLWVGCLMCVISMNEIKASKTVPQLKELTWTAPYFWLTVFLVFSAFWLLTFIENLANMVVMIATATYYFNNSKETIENQQEAEVCTSVRMTYISHFGTVAIGSFIVGLVRFIKWTIIAVCQWIEHCTAEGQNAVAKCFLGCVMCIVDCFETITEYITEGAYEYAAVTGDGFCSSAYDSMLLKLKHLGEFAWTQFFGSMFIFIGKVACITLNVILYCYLLHPMMVDPKQVTSKIVPAIVVGLATYIMVSIFLGMFSMSANTMMTCYAIDVDVNGEHKFGPETFFNNIEKMKEANNSIKDARNGTNKTGTAVGDSTEVA